MENSQFSGWVMRSTGSWYEVRSQDTQMVHSCRAGGRLRLTEDRSTNPIAVGDEVICTLSADGEPPLIIERKDRRNAIIRKSVNLSKATHVVAANLDRVFLIVTAAFPETSEGFIDRFLVTAEAYGVPTTLVFNKCDLFEPGSIEEARLMELEAVYQQVGYSTLRASAKTGQGLDALQASLAEAGVTLISGNSGVGKSTLINRLLPELALKTGEVSSAHNKGKHTTTFAEMFAMPSGGFLIDTPGIKGFGLVELERDKLHHYFPEMFALLPTCKFHNCLHRSEPKCAVRNAVESGKIPTVRYENYLGLYEGFEEDSNYR